MNEVLDTRFFIELFYSNKAENRKKTKDKIKLSRDREGIVPSIVLAELVKVVCEKHGNDEARIAHFSVVRSGLEIVPMTSDLARVAGLIGCRYKKLPMGDCIIAATAVKAKAIVVTDDPHFDEIKEINHTWIK